MSVKSLLKSSIVLSLLPFAVGCGSSATPRSISGALTLIDYQLDHAVVIAQSTRRQIFIAPVSAAGHFRLAVPAGATYRLLLANTTSPGAYRTISRINWATPGASVRWAKLGAGSAIALGTLHRVGTSVPSTGLTTASSEIGDTGAENTDTGADNSCGEQGDNQGDHQNADAACGSEQDGAQICDAQDASDSESDTVIQDGETADDAQDQQNESDVENETNASCGDSKQQEGNDGEATPASNLATIIR